MNKTTWEQQRLEIVGASEISTVIRHTMAEEELKKAMGRSYNTYKEEQEFSTPYELYHLKKGNFKKDFPVILSEFGHAMEKYAEKYLNDFDFLDCFCQPQEIVKSDLHKLAGYTPDIFLNFTQNAIFKGREVKQGDKAVVEVKTYNYLKAVREKVEEVGLAWQYILQNQYQTWIQNKIDSNYKWAMQVYITPLDLDFDNDYYKGQAVAHCSNIRNEKSYQWLVDHYDIGIDIHPIYKSLHPIFIKALDRWQDIIENEKEPEPDFIKNGDIVKNKIKNSFEEIISYCKVKYDINNGCIDLKEIVDICPNIRDEAKIYNEKCKELSNIKKEVDEDKIKWMDFFLKTKILGVDDSNFTLKVAKSGSGFTVKSSFKNSEEIFSKKIASEKY